ncbi:hypothetical protein [Limosilactobacillus reuteri]|uniref:hypothetical protein n=1 Tax=Limosilactobacillus reuteri TaxID=1598 RepID=UPI0002F7C2EA|nr:hypothetical protein [Limosilactobacillus reuteri]
MDLEELELRFRANYGDVLQKMDELTSLIGQKTNDMQVKIQSNLDRIQQNMNDNASKANEKAKEEVRQREEAENSKQKSIERTASVQDDATNRIIEGNKAQAESSKEAVNQSEKSLDSLTARLQEAANMQQRIAQQTKVARETVGDIPVKQAQQEVRPKEKPRPRIKNSSFDDYQEKRIQSYMPKRPVDLGIDDEIQAEVSRAKKEIDGLVSHINEKMQQAQSMQRRIATLMASRDNLDMNKQGSQVRAMRLDDQIANAQVKMERYQNQAKALAQEMSQELNTIPNSLKRIEREMDQTEAKIERIRRTIAETKAQDAVLGRSSGNNKGLKEAEAEYKRLINRSNELAKAYSYVSSRGDELRNASSRVNTTLAQEGNTASNTSSRLSRLRNTISNVTSSFRRMGDSGSSSMRRAGTSASLLSERLKGVKMAMSMLASQLIVFTLLYQGIMMLAQGMGSALMTNRQFASSFNAIKVNLLTAFYPIYSYVLPAINALMNALRKATGWIAQFTSALTGMSLSGARSGAKGLYNQVRAMNDTSKVASKASDAVKKQQQEQAKAVQRANQQIAEANRQGAAAVAAENEKIKAANEQAKKAFEDTKKANEDLQASLMGFDELNVLDNNKNNSDNSSFEAQPLEKFTPQQKQDTPIFDDPGIDDGGVGDEGDPSIDWNVPLEASQNAIDAANRVKKVLGELFDPMKEAWDEKGQAVVNAAKYSWGEVKRLLGDVGHSFMHVWDNGTGQRVVENLLQLLADMLNIIGDIARAFAEAWEEGGRGTKFIQAIFNALNNVLELIHHIATSFREAWNDGTGERIAAHLIELFTGLANIVGNLASQFDKAWQHGNVGTSIFKTLLGMVDDMLAALSDMANYTANWAKKLDFTPLLQSIDTLLKSIRPVTKDVWAGLEWAYKNVLLPLAGFTITKLLPDFFNLLAAALKVVHSVIKAAEPIFEWFFDGFLKPLAKITGFAIVGALKLLTGALNLLSDWIDHHQTAVKVMTTTLMTLFSLKVAGKTISSIKDFTDTLKIVTMLSFDKLKAGAKYADDLLGTVIEFGKHPITKIQELAKIKFDNFKTGVGKVKDLWNEVNKKWQSTNLAKTDFLKSAKSSIKSGEPMKLGQKLGIGLSTAMIAVTSGIDIYKGIKAKNKETKFKDFGSGIGGAIGGGIGLFFGGPIGAAIGQQIGSFIGKWGGIGASKFGDGWAKYGKGKKPKDWVEAIGFKSHEILDNFTSWAKQVGPNISNYIGKSKKNIEKAGKNIDKWTTGFINDTQKTLKKWASSIGTNFNKDVEKSKKLAVVGSNKLKSWTTGFVDDAKKNIKKWAQKIGSNINTDVEKGKKFAKNAGTKLKEWTTDFRESASQRVRSWAENLGDHINNGSESSRSGSTNAGNKLSEWTRSFFNDANSSIHNWAGNLGGHVSNGISGAYNAAKNAGERLGSWVSNFRDGTSRTLGSWAGGLGSTIGGGITSGLHNISSAIGKVVDAIVRPVQKATDKIREGINWVLGKLGGGSVGWGYFNWNAYKTGTQNHPGGLALVNDQDGDIYRESYELPNGEQGLFPAKRNFLTYLPAGTKVKTATNTANELANMVPKYAGGIGSFNFDFSGISRALSGLNFGGLFSGISDVFDSAMDELANVTDDIAHPEKLINYIADKFVTYDWGVGETPLKLAKGAVNTEKKGMVNWAKRTIEEFGGSVSAYLPKGVMSKSAFARTARKAALLMRQKLSSKDMDRLYWQAWDESTVNPAQGGGYDDHDGTGLPLGLYQYKVGTWNSWSVPGHKNIYSALNQTMAVLNDSNWRNDLAPIGVRRGWGPTGHKMMANGGLVTENQLIEVAENNMPEMVVPLSNPALGMQRINEAIAFMNRNFGGGLQLPTALSNNAITPNSMYAESSSSNDVAMQNGGFKEMSTNLVNAIVQALQMQNTTNNSNQPVDLHLTVKIGDESFGEHAIKGINAVNQKNGRNMLNI